MPKCSLKNSSRFQECITNTRVVDMETGDTRWSQLQRELERAIDASLANVSPEEIRQLMTYLWGGAGAPSVPSTLRALRQRVNTKGLELANRQLVRQQFAERLNELEHCIRRAEERRRRYSNDVSAAPPQQQPVQLTELTPQQLVDARLRPERQRWLRDLNARLADAEAEHQGLMQALAARQLAIKAREEALEPRIAALEAASAHLSRP